LKPAITIIVTIIIIIIVSMIIRIIILIVFKTDRSAKIYTRPIYPLAPLFSATTTHHHMPVGRFHTFWTTRLTPKHPTWWHVFGFGRWLSMRLAGQTLPGSNVSASDFGWKFGCSECVH